jgi:thiamine monophosphate kinase
MQLGDLQEKGFIKEVISRYAVTAALDQFDDCVVIDLEQVCDVEGLPYLVYSLDHPSFIRSDLDPELAHRFYGRWVAAIVCGDVLAMGAHPRGFSVDLAAPLDMDSLAVDSSGCSRCLGCLWCNV